MKKITILSMTMIALLPALSHAEGPGKHGGFYCTKAGAGGQATLSFVPVSPSDDHGVMVVISPGKAPVVVQNAVSDWSGSMFITTGNGIFIQGPGNGGQVVSLLEANADPDPSMTFDYASECVGL